MIVVMRRLRGEWRAVAVADNAEQAWRWAIAHDDEERKHGGDPGVWQMVPALRAVLPS